MINYIKRNIFKPLSVACQIYYAVYNEIYFSFESRNAMLVIISREKKSDRTL